MADSTEIGAQSLARQAYEYVVDGILSGDLSPGQRLSLRPLGKALGMGKAPISEALRELAQNGLIDLEPGATVRLFSPGDVRDQHMMRIALECEAARHCATTASEKELDELTQLADRIDRNIDEQSSQEQLRKSDFELHLKIATYGGCRRFVEALKANQLERLVALSSALIWNRQLGMPEREHGHLIEAIRTRNPDTAERAMRDHCERAMRFQLDAMHLQPPDRSAND